MPWLARTLDRHLSTVVQMPLLLQGAALHRVNGKHLHPVFPPALNLQINSVPMGFLRCAYCNIHMHVSSASITQTPSQGIPYPHIFLGTQVLFLSFHYTTQTFFFISNKLRSLLNNPSNYLKQIFSNLNPSLPNDQSHKPHYC